MRRSVYALEPAETRDAAMVSFLKASRVPHCPPIQEGRWDPQADGLGPRQDAFREPGWPAVFIAFVLCWSASLPVGAAEPALPWDPSPPSTYLENWPVDVSEETAVLAKLGPEYSAMHTRHFSVIHASPPEIARYRGEILESVFTAFVLFFQAKDFELTEPQHLLQTAFFQKRATFVSHVGIADLPSDVVGLYRPDLSRAYFYETLGRMRSRQTTKAARKREHELKSLRRRVRRSDDSARFNWRRLGNPVLNVSRAEALRRIHKELTEQKRANRAYREELGQGSIETMCHEAIHQLTHRMGVIPADRAAPRWLTEGLAAFFEPSRNGYLLETGAVHWNRWDQLSRAHARGERVRLSELLENDSLLLSGRKVSLAYDESWSLVHYLATKRRGAFMDYLRALRRVSPGSSAADRAVLFERVFGAKTKKLEAEWRAHVEGLGKPPK